MQEAGPVGVGGVGEGSGRGGDGVITMRRFGEEEQKEIE